jgi:DNA-binding GntR family transcriptional regulator/DNA-binding CsgD family transcriptional regulator
LVDEIADLLRERIIEGRYAADTPLSQRGLAEELSVARGVVGEALRMLRRQGLVDTRLGAGVRVAVDDRSVFLSAYAVREVIDGLAARLAAGHPGPGIKGRCAAALEEQRVAVGSEDRLRYMRANVAFHATMIDGSGSPVLRGHTWLVRSTSRSAAVLRLERMRQSVQEHEAILAAVTGSEPEQAERAARAHVSATIEALRQMSYDEALARLADRQPSAARLLAVASARFEELGMREWSRRAALVEVAESELPDHLTAREAEILRLVALGGTNKEIAADLVLSVHTVERHIQNAYRKISARNRADASTYVARVGL